MRLCRWIERRLVPLAVMASVVAYLFPPAFAWMQSLIPFFLGWIMLGMGITLAWSDFQRALSRPKLLLGGVAAQYLVMPLLGFVLARALRLSPAVAAGVILLGACPGGTASNVIAFLARADVGLSVSLTLFSTLLSPLFTPWLTWLYAHETIQVDTLSLMHQTFWIVVFPLLDGLVLRHFFRAQMQPLLDYFPALSVLIIVAVIGCVMALNADRFTDLSFPILLAVILHNGGGLYLGYLVGGWLSTESAVRRTLSIEVGMQNSGLAVALSLQTPTFGPLAALPGALFSLWHNLSGSTLAAYWAYFSGSDRES